MIAALLVLFLILAVLGVVSSKVLLIAALVVLAAYVFMGPGRAVEGRRRWY